MRTAASKNRPSCSPFKARRRHLLPARCHTKPDRAPNDAQVELPDQRPGVGAFTFEDANLTTELYDTIWTDLSPGVDALVARRRRHRRRLIAVASVTAGALVVAGAAIGASKLLGWPAPEHVRHDLAAVDTGLPSDLRLNPDVQNARAVAATASSTLYAADLSDGGHCTEIVTDAGRGRGAVCQTAQDLPQQPIELVLPSDDNAAPSAPVTLGGRVNVHAQRLEVSYGKVTRDVPLGDGGYFVFDLPAGDRAAAHGSEIVLTARDPAGRAVARVVGPNDWDKPAVPDDRAPLFVSTRSDEHDLTKVYGIEGHVSAPGATKLELRYNDGAAAAIPLDAHNGFLYVVPPARIDAFMRPQRVVALDARGDVVAQSPVAAVAYWRGAQRHR